MYLALAYSGAASLTGAAAVCRGVDRVCGGKGFDEAGLQHPRRGTGGVQGSHIQHATSQEGHAHAQPHSPGNTNTGYARHHCTSRYLWRLCSCQLVKPKSCCAQHCWLRVSSMQCQSLLSLCLGCNHGMSCTQCNCLHCPVAVDGHPANCVTHFIVGSQHSLYKTVEGQGKLAPSRQTSSVILADPAAAILWFLSETSHRAPDDGSRNTQRFPSSVRHSSKSHRSKQCAKAEAASSSISAVPQLYSLVRLGRLCSITEAWRLTMQLRHAPLHANKT